MDIKNRNEIAQFRWNFLVFMFFACLAFIYPVGYYLHNNSHVSIKSIIFNAGIGNWISKDIVIDIFCGILAAIPVGICVFLQRVWLLKIKLSIAMLILLFFILVSQVYFSARIFLEFLVLLIFFIPAASGLLFYNFILKPCHKKYYQVDKEIISIIESLHGLLWITYICLVFMIITIFIVAGIIDIGSVGQPSPFKIYDWLLPLISFISSAFWVLLPQFFVFTNVEWSGWTKVINSIAVGIVFIAVGLISCLKYVDPFMMVLIGGILLRHIFIKSSLNALERNREIKV